MELDTQDKRLALVSLEDMSDYPMHNCRVVVNYFIECGRCRHEWYLGTAYQEPILCPVCGLIAGAQLT